MFRKTLVAFAAAATLGLGALVFSPIPASAYHGDYERYCYYHRYDPACWRYWHRDYDDYDRYSSHHRHHHDYDHDHDHEEHHHDHDHDHNHDHDHDHDHH